MGCFFGRIRLWKNSTDLLSRKISTQSCLRFSNSCPQWNCILTIRLSIQIINLTNSGLKFLTLRNSWHEAIWFSAALHILSTRWGERNHSDLWNPRWGNCVFAPSPELWTQQSEWRLPILGSLFLWVSEAAGFITTVCKDALRSFPISFILRESIKFFPSCSLKSFLTMWILCSLTLNR